MGTNYYLRNKPCVTCGHYKNEKHIGKSSSGWTFHFRGYREESLITYKDWMDQIEDPNKLIFNEYGEEVSISDFKELVENKKDGLNHYNITHYLPMTDSEREYLDKIPNSRYDSYEINQKSWKDDEGHAFTDWEFC